MARSWKQFFSAFARARVQTELVRPSDNAIMLRPGGTGYNWGAAVGDLHANGTVAIGLKTIVDKVRVAEVVALKKVKKKLVVDDSATQLAEIFLNAGAFTFSDTLVILVSSLKLFGMAYLVVERDLGGKPIYATPFMSNQVKPRIVDGRQKYDVTPHGSSAKLAERYDAEDVVVFRDGIPDPRNSSQFISPLLAMLREVCTDNEISTFMASLLQNAGIPGYILIPKGNGDKPVPKSVKEMLREAFLSVTRDRRGEPLILGSEVEVKTVGLDPKNLEVATVWRDTTMRILGALGVDPLVCSMPSDNKTFANYEQARLALIQDTVIPVIEVVLKEMTDFLRSEGLWSMARGSTQLMVDKSSFAELAALISAKIGDAEKLFKSNIITRDEARLMLEMDEAGDKRLYTEIIAEMKASGGRARAERKRLEEVQSIV